MEKFVIFAVTTGNGGIEKYYEKKITHNRYDHYLDKRGLLNNNRKVQ